MMYFRPLKLTNTATSFSFMSNLPPQRHQISHQIYQKWPLVLNLPKMAPSTLYEDSRGILQVPNLYIIIYLRYLRLMGLRMLSVHLYPPFLCPNMSPPKHQFDLLDELKCITICKGVASELCCIEGIR